MTGRAILGAGYTLPDGAVPVQVIGVRGGDKARLAHDPNIVGREGGHGIEPVVATCAEVGIGHLAPAAAVPVQDQRTGGATAEYIADSPDIVGPGGGYAQQLVMPAWIVGA